MDTDATVWAVDPNGLSASTLVPPVSKSDAQRALVLAHALSQPALRSFCSEPVERVPSDVRVLDAGLSALGAARGETVDIDCADGGAPFRFLLSQAAVTPGAHVRLSGTRRLGERPHGALFAALRLALGPSGLVIREGTPWPVEVIAPRETGEPVFRVSGEESSQYASSLLLAAAALHVRERRTWRVETLGRTASEGYFALTVQWLERCGFGLARTAEAVSVQSWSAPESFPDVPGDWSSLGYLLLVAWRSGGAVARVNLEAAHPDRAIVRVMEHAGLRLERKGDLVQVRGELAAGVVANGAECPDLLPTLAALACVAPGESVFEGVEILRHKESDRLRGIIDLVAASGGQTTLENGDTRLRVRPGAIPPLLLVDSHGDHRLAMAAATASVLTGARLQLADPECVTKSFPGFWHELACASVRSARLSCR